jgi:DNA modification methylase
VTPFTFHQGDAVAVLRTMPASSVHCCVTSPPYWGLRDYNAEGQIGQEQTPDDYAARLVEVFREVRRVLRDDGTLWLNLGDSYSSGGRTTQCSPGGKPGQPTISQGMRRAPTVDSLKPKDLVGIPWMVAFALRADGWYLRSDIIWSKPNPMPESVTHRPTKAHEYLFLLSKSERYYYDAEAIKEPAITAGDDRGARTDNAAAAPPAPAARPVTGSATRERREALPPMPIPAPTPAAPDAEFGRWTSDALAPDEPERPTPERA